MESSYVQKMGRMAVASLVLAGACNHPVKTRTTNPINQDSVTPPSGLTVESSQIDFGRTIIGTTPSQAVHISNTTGATVTLTISPLEGVDSQLFSTTPGAGSEIAIPDQESKTVLITYAPQVASDTPSQASFKLQQCMVGDGCSFGITLQGLPVVADVSVSPDPMAFGFVLTQTSVTRTLAIGNQSSQAIHLTADPQVVTQNGDGSAAAIAMFSLSVDGPKNGATIEAGGSLSIDVTFSPTDTAAYPGELFLFTDDALNPSFVVPLSGVGGGPSMSCSPSTIDYGRHTAGIGVTQQVVCTNLGQDVPGHPESKLFIPDPNHSGPGLSIANGDPAYSAAFDQPFPAAGLASGDSATIDVTYNASVEGQDSDTLVIGSNDPLAPQMRIALSGSALVLPNCNYQVLPKNVLTFGHVQSGAEAVLPFAIVNTQTGDCLANGFQLRAGSSPAFSLPDYPQPPLQGVVLHAGERLPIKVRFAPTISSDSFTGTVDFTISDPTSPDRSIALEGSSLETCLVVQPGAIDFGVTGYDAATATYCPSATRTVTVQTSCSSNSIVSLQLLDVGSSPSFVITGDPSPVNLSGTCSYSCDFTTATFNVTFAPSEVGEHLGGIQIVSSSVDGPPDPFLIPLRGVATQDGTRTDRVTARASAVDLLWVIDTDDDSPGQQVLVDAMTGFLAYPMTNGLDLHIATTSTDVYAMPTSEDGRMEPCPGCKIDGTAMTVINSAMGRDAAVTALGTLLRLGDGAYCQTNGCNGFGQDEQIFEATYEALSPDLLTGYNQPFYRPDALLAVIAFDDDSEDDLSNAHTLAFYYDNFIGVKGVENARKFSFSYLNYYGGTSAVRKLGQMAVLTGGVQADRSNTDWPDELGALWPKLDQQLLTYPLSAPPVESGLQVTVNGVVLPATSTAGTNWTFDATSNSLRFDPLARPQSGDAIEITYTIACGN